MPTQCKSYSLSVIIPTHNRLSYLIKILGILSTQTVLPNEIIIVDNSTDEITCNFIKQKKFFTNIKLNYIRKQNNTSSYLARNIGIRKSKNDILVFLDDDCFPEKNWIKEIKASLINNQTDFLMGNNQIGAITIPVSIAVNFLVNRFFTSGFYLLKNQQFSSQLDTKNFAVFRKILLNSNLYFDENFKVFHGDADFGLRIAQLNLKIRYCPTMVIYHFGYESVKELIKKGFLQGLERYHFNQKWKSNAVNILKMQNKKDLLSDMRENIVIRKLSMQKQVLCIFYMFLFTCMYRLGLRYAYLKHYLG